MIWELVIIFGISWAGAGGQRHSDMPDKETCFMALESAKININGTLVTGENGDVVIAFCRPKTKSVIK